MKPYVPKPFSAETKSEVEAIVARLKAKARTKAEASQDLSPRIGKPFPAHEVLLGELKTALKKGGSDMGYIPEAQKKLETLSETLGQQIAQRHDTKQSEDSLTGLKEPSSERVIAFSVLKDGTFAQQIQNILQQDDMKLWRAVYARFAPTLNDLLLNGPPFVQSDWMDATVPVA